MDEILNFTGGKYHRIYISKRVQMTLKAEMFTLKRGQTINGHKLKKSQDVWFPNFFKTSSGETEECFYAKSVGITSAIYVHEEHYKKLKFVEI